MPNPRGRDRTQTARHATQPAILPGLEPPRFGNAAQDRWAEGVTGRLGILAGTGRSRWDKAVTHRELEDRIEQLGLTGPQTAAGTPPAGVPVIGENGQSQVLGYDAFFANITGTKLYRDLQRRIDDPTRFSDLIPRVQEILLAELAPLDGRIGAEVSRLEEAMTSQGQSYAVAMEQVAARAEASAAGVRRTAAATANRTRAVATEVTTVTAGLADMGGEDPGTATVEEIMLAVADRWDGLRAQYTIKVATNGAMAGIGLSATTSAEGNATSHVIIMADKFAVVGSGDTLGGLGTTASPYTPPAGRVPFGVDTVNDTVYVAGTLRVGSGTGSRIDAVGRRISLTAPTNAFLIDRSGTAAPTSITITATRLNGLTGTTTWSVVNGTATLTSTSDTSATLANTDLTTDTATIQASVTMDGTTYTAQFTINRSYSGNRGAVSMNGNAYGISSTSWSDNIANRVVRNAVMGESLTTSLADTSLNRVGDTVTLSNNGGTFAATKYWSASGGGTWTTAAAYINGNLFVDGTVTANAVDVTTDIVVEGQGRFNGSTSSTEGSYAVVANSDFNAVSGVIGFSNGSRFGVAGVNTATGVGVVGQAAGGGIGVRASNSGSGVALYAASISGHALELAAGTFRWGSETYSAPDGSSYKFMNADGGWTSIGSISSGSSTGTFVGTSKPGASTNNTWLAVNIGGTTYDVPAWPRA